MKLTEVVTKLDLTEIVSQGERLVAAGYVSDLLSDVMGNATADSIWITIQTHQNIVAVAVVTDISAIIIANGVQPDEDTIKKAKEQGIAVYTSEKTSFTLAGMLYELGLPGRSKRH